MRIRRLLASHRMLLPTTPSLRHIRVVLHPPSLLLLPIPSLWYSQLFSDRTAVWASLCMALSQLLSDSRVVSHPLPFLLLSAPYQHSQPSSDSRAVSHPLWLLLLPTPSQHSQPSSDSTTMLASFHVPLIPDSPPMKAWQSRSLSSPPEAAPPRTTVVPGPPALRR